MIPGALEANITSVFTGSSNEGRDGTKITAGGSPHTLGLWTTLIPTSSAVAAGIYVKVVGVGSSGTATSMLMDIGIGALGAENVLIPNLLVGYAGSALRTGGRTYFFPVAIPSGSHISARCQSLIASDTADVSIWLTQDIHHLKGASSVEAIGVTSASSDGTVVTPGASSFGSWTNLGSVSSDVNCIVPGTDAAGDDRLSEADGFALIKLGYGTSDPDSGGTEIDAVWIVKSSGREYIISVFPNTPVYADITSGDNIYASINARSTSALQSVIVHAMQCPSGL